MLYTYLYYSSISVLYLFVQMSVLREIEYLPLEVKAHLLIFSFLHPPQGLAQPVVDTRERQQCEEWRERGRTIWAERSLTGKRSFLCPSMLGTIK